MEKVTAENNVDIFHPELPEEKRRNLSKLSTSSNGTQNESTKKNIIYSKKLWMTGLLVATIVGAGVALAFGKPWEPATKLPHGEKIAGKTNGAGEAKATYAPTRSGRG